MPEWLRGLTRNQMGFPRAGSNPAGDAFFIILFFHLCFAFSPPPSTRELLTFFF